MSENISTIILSESRQTRDVLKLYLDEFGNYNYLADFFDLSEIFNTLSSLPKSLLIVDLSTNSSKFF